MSRDAIRKSYSCRRKRDYITLLAILLFLVMLGFQVYLILFLPVQLKHDESLEIHKVRQTLLRGMDDSRPKFRYIETRKGSLEEGEVRLVKGVFDHLAMFVREYENDLTLDQLGDLIKTVRRLRSVMEGWNFFPPHGADAGPAGTEPHFAIRRETIDRDRYVRLLDGRIRQQEEKQP